MKRFDKQFDLEKSEYRKSDAKEPFWGFNAVYVGIMLLLSLPIGAIASWLVTGQFPYWLR